MKKLVLVAGLGLGLLGLAVGVAIVFAGSLAREAIERGGTAALGVETTLASADLGLFSGRFGMRDLSVANPEGFEAEHFLRLDRAEFEVSLGSLSADLVEAPLLLIDGLVITLEKQDGRTNYGKILKRLERLQGEGDSDEDEDAADGSEKKFVIREVVLSNIVAHIDLIPRGGELTKVSVKIPEIRLEDVGEDGESLAEVVGELTQVLLAAIVQAGGDVIPGEMLGDLTQGLGSLKTRGFELSQGVVTRVEGLGENLGELGGALGENAGELLDGASKKLDSGLKKLFDRD